MNYDGTYSVKYMDGDAHDNKIASEIRHTKNSKLSSARSNRNMHSSRDSHIPSQSNQGTARKINLESSPKSTGIGFQNTSTGMPSNSISARNLGPETHGSMSFTNCPDTLSMDGNSYSLSNGSARPSFYKHPSSRSAVGLPFLNGLMEKSPARTYMKETIIIKSPRINVLNIPFECGGAAQRTLTALLAASSIKKPCTDFTTMILAKSSDSSHGIKSPDSAISRTIFQPFENLNDVEVVSRRAPFLGQRPSHRKSWKSEDSRCSADSYESDGQTFAIPSVFPTPRTERKADGECVLYLLHSFSSTCLIS